VWKDYTITPVRRGGLRRRPGAAEPGRAQESEHRVLALVFEADELDAEARGPRVTRHPAAAGHRGLVGQGEAEADLVAHLEGAVGREQHAPGAEVENRGRVLGIAHHLDVNEEAGLLPHRHGEQFREALVPPGVGREAQDGVGARAQDLGIGVRPGAAGQHRDGSIPGQRLLPKLPDEAGRVRKVAIHQDHLNPEAGAHEPGIRELLDPVHLDPLPPDHGLGEFGTQVAPGTDEGAQHGLALIVLHWNPPSRDRPALSGPGISPPALQLTSRG
jgi:hypothetical protein